MKHFAVVIIFVTGFLVSKNSFAQNYDTTIINYDKIYYSWEEASWMPQRVVNLYLFNSGTDTLSPLIKEMKNLQVLFLKNNLIQSLPLEIGFLPYLTKLNVAKNRLENLPLTFTRLKTLEELDLSFNSLDSLPYDIGKLTHLKKLYLQNNRLNKLPKSICQLSELELLNLSNNNLDTLPKEIRLMTNLKQLVLTGNDIDDHSKDIIKRFLQNTEVIY
ncbi:MAG: leucine-rich repeat domain-containing protein [Bacteroidales bacterium]|nr:leucine-rich repeat domain-containing protein [Bacteroidales bacterium]